MVIPIAGSNNVTNLFPILTINTDAFFYSEYRNHHALLLFLVTNRVDNFLFVCHVYCSKIPHPNSAKDAFIFLVCGAINIFSPGIGLIIFACLHPSKFWPLFFGLGNLLGFPILISFVMAQYGQHPSVLSKPVMDMYALAVIAVFVLFGILGTIFSIILIVRGLSYEDVDLGEKNSQESYYPFNAKQKEDVFPFV